MPHSTVQNAGQKYASARKHGIIGAELKNLKAAARNRRHAPSPENELPEVIRQRIETANREHQERSRWHSN